MARASAFSVFFSIVVLVLVTLAPPAPAAGADVVLRYALRASQTVGAHTSGSVTVEIYNLSGKTLDNVDVRLAQPGSNAIERGLLQLGRVAIGQTGRATGGYTFTAANGAPLLWRVDYDVAGEHKQIVVQGIQQQEGR
jgi:hypothetical protein